MAAPIFKPMHAPHVPSAIPKSVGTALFVHRLKQAVQPHKPAAKQQTAGGHPILHAPIVVKPAKSVHTSGTSLINVPGQNSALY